jgi:hypothetical protein
MKKLVILFVFLQSYQLIAADISINTTNGAQLTVNNAANLQIETCPLPATENSCP